MNDPCPPNLPPADVLPPEAPGLRALTPVVAGVTVIGGLYFGREVLIPITLAVLLSFLVEPVVEFLRRLKLGQVPSVIVAVLVALGFVLAVGALIGAQVTQLAGSLPQYQVAIEHKVVRLQELTTGRPDALLGNAASALKRVTPTHTPPPTTGGNAAAETNDSPMPVEVYEPSPSALQLAQRFLSPVISPLETTGIVLVVAIVTLLQRVDLRDRLIRLFGSRDLHRTTTALDEAARRLSRYFLAQLGINFGVGIIVSIGLTVIGVPGALLFGLLTMLLRFVPYVGTWVAALLAMTLAATGPGWTMLVWTVALFGMTDVIARHVVEPMMWKHSTGISPLAVIVAAIFWSWIWGPIGFVLSTPLTLCLLVLGRHVDRLGFLDVLFGDQPALTPAQNFYQRLLANDPTQALVQAETILQERSLTAYYDEVALEGLRFAHGDLARGVVTVAQLQRIKESAFDIVEGLEEAVGLRPPVNAERDLQASHTGSEDPQALEAPPTVFDATLEGNTSSVLCIAGRGELDELAAIIAIQLLKKRGLDTILASYEHFSRSRFGEVDLTDVSTVCVVSLDAADHQPYLRNLLRRLRQRANAVDLIVGLVASGSSWPSDFPVRAILAAKSFRELVDVSIEAARRQSRETASSRGPGAAPGFMEPTVATAGQAAKASTLTSTGDPI